MRLWLSSGVFALLGAIVLTTAAAAAPDADKAARIISLDGSLTEIIYALGAGDRLVAVDVTSRYPEDAKRLPQIGYMRSLSAEGVLALQPDLILATTEAGPAPVVEQIENTGVRVLMIPERHSFEGVVEKIQAVSSALGISGEGRELIARLKERRAELNEILADGGQPKAVFLMAQGPDVLMAAGRKTAANAMLELAGAENVISDYEGYKPVSAESLALMRPDILVVGTRTVDAAGGLDAFLRLPALAATGGTRNGGVVVMEDMYLLGFGPRTGDAAVELARKLRD